MWLDRFSIRNLELIRSNHETGTSLFEILNQTVTPMGARKLAKWIVLPLKTIPQIEKRHNSVEALLNNEEALEKIVDWLQMVGDLERVSSKIPLGKINPREYVGIKNTLKVISDLKDFLVTEFQDSALSALVLNLDPCHRLVELIENTLDENAPVNLKKGGVIKEGWNQDLDEWRSISNNAKEILLELQQNEIEKTGISSLKIGFNNVFGYYLRSH